MLTFECQLKDAYEILNVIYEEVQLIDRNIFGHDIDKQDNEHKQHNHRLRLPKIEMKLMNDFDNSR